MLSLRYLRARRQEGFISIIAGFSFLGIMLGVAIGRRLADQLSLRSGDNITLVAPRGAVTPMGTTPRIKVYKVAAVFEIGMSEYDSSVVFMPLKEAQAYFNRAGDVTAIEVYTDDPDHIDRFRKLVTEAAQRPIFMIDWRQRNATFFNALQVERNVMFLILTLIVLVAALNIVSGLIMLVKDKGSDIAILRTMGATQGSIMRVFLITGASIGVVGTIVGLLLGIVVCLNVESIRQFLSWLTNTELFSPELYFLSKLPADMDTGETTAVVVMALALSLLATLYPSWRAARLDPVEALRYE
jgi:lipoprotein-releasing system permease protein